MSGRHLCARESSCALTYPGRRRLIRTANEARNKPPANSPVAQLDRRALISHFGLAQSRCPIGRVWPAARPSTFAARHARRRGQCCAGRCTIMMSSSIERQQAHSIGPAEIIG